MEWQLVAPRAKLSLSWSGNLEQILLGGFASDIVYLLAVPVRQQHGSPQSSLVESTNTIREEERGGKHSMDDNSPHNESSQRRKQIILQDQNAKTVLEAVITLSSLPTEIHLHIFSFLEEFADVISLSMTNRYFLSIGHKNLENCYVSHYGRWANTSIVCVSDDTEQNDYPPGMFSNEELEVLRQTTIEMSPYSQSFSHWQERNTPFNLRHFSHPDVSVVENPREEFSRMLKKLKDDCTSRGIYEDPAYPHIRPYLTNETYFPTNQKWVLRNLTTKQIVHSDSIALKTDHVNGPYIQVQGFGEALLSRILWSTWPRVIPEGSPTLTRGVWAGHCFDITTLSRHEAETDGEEWEDVSKEVARELTGIWEELGEVLGADWLQILDAQDSLRENHYFQNFF